MLCFRICTPHELSAIQEVDTPTTSRVHVVPSQSQGECCISISTTFGPEEDKLDGISLSDDKIEDVNLSFMTLPSQEDEDSGNRSIDSAESIDIIEELMRRGIITSPFPWAKKDKEKLDNDDDHDDKRDEQGGLNEDLSSSQLADEEVRGILKESSPEDIETVFDSLGIGWAGATLRKTRQANELSADSSSSNDFNTSRSKTSRKTGGNNLSRRKISQVETSTPENVKSRNTHLIPVSDPDISTVKLSTSSDMLPLTPPDVSLRPRMQMMTLSDESIGSLS